MSLEARLRAAGCVYAEEEAALLRAEATGEALASLVARRVAGEPLEQVLGWAELAGVRVRLRPGVFVPRQRTAALVELADPPPGGLVVDLCCGSGAVGAALTARRPDLEVHAADVDPAAVACARTNLPPTRVHEGDLYDALPPRLRGRVDLLAVNAPYVPTDEVALMPAEARDHEHRVALDGGADGLDLHRRVAAGAPTWLAPAGVLLLETSERQAGATHAACEAAGLRAEVVTRPEVGATVVRAVASSRAAGRWADPAAGPTCG